jgi:hypothetical protein
MKRGVGSEVDQGCFARYGRRTRTRRSQPYRG